MREFLKSDDFKSINLGFALDEGMKVTCKGSPGHGSRFIENSAAEKMGGVQANVVPPEMSS
ncbi:adenylate cyclase, partial [Desmophyllum pertusum]